MTRTPATVESRPLARLARWDKSKQKVENVSLVFIWCTRKERVSFGVPVYAIALENWDFPKFYGEKIDCPYRIGLQCNSELMKISQVVLVNALTDKLWVSCAFSSGLGFFMEKNLTVQNSTYRIGLQCNSELVKISQVNRGFEGCCTTSTRKLERDHEGASKAAEA
ncbi:hypothetical protein DKX38_025990 [Salix brachista]|uniref:Uncharacterized protein n=1 Tax=Salix brachista TaxID=2182728 RepID=A0A5N5JQF9_9ROSI|nr:hypothetical protein DKX38_025990 [Salix brachista]